MYKISVIMPVYNGESDLDNAINSVINQTIGFENIEFLIIDDCSTDNSKNVIKSYCKKYENIIGIYLPKNFGGPGQPRNVGIDNANGKYVMFLDCDDYYSLDICETLYHAIESNDVDLVKCGYYHHYYDIITKNIEFGNLTGVFNSFFQKEMIGSGSLGTCIFKNEIIQKYNIKNLEGNTLEDLYFCYQYYCNSNNVLYLSDYYGYHYVIQIPEFDDLSMSRNTNITKLLKFLESFEKIYGYLESQNLDKEQIENYTCIISLCFYLICKLENKNEQLIILKKLNILENQIIEKYDGAFKFDNLFDIIYNKLLFDEKYYFNIIISRLFIKLYYNNFFRKIYRRLSIY